MADQAPAPAPKPTVAATVQKDASQAEAQVNGFWNTAVAWVKAHPKTTIAIAVVTVLVAAFVL